MHMREVPTPALVVDLDALGFYSLHRGGGATALRYVADRKAVGKVVIDVA